MKIKTMSDADAALRSYISSIPKTNWDFALEQMQALMRQLGNPQDKLSVIHVAGTSGKTSTSYYIAEMLRRSGKKVGLTVSPHVDGVNERIQINGQPLSPTRFCELLDEFLQLPAVQATHPSYFGLLVAMAYWVFAKEGVDYAVIEVGMGGRLDATNVISNPNKVCVMTDIGLDHTAMLGKTIQAIATEKAGIIHPNNQVFMLNQDADATGVIIKKSKVVAANLELFDQAHDAPANLPLFQQRNWSLARAAAEYVSERDGLGLQLSDMAASATIVIPARMEVFERDGKAVLIDGAHNAQKITALCQSIQQKYPDTKLACLVSFSYDKSESMKDKIATLNTIADHLIITTFSGEQDFPKWSVEPKTIQDAAEQAGCKSVEVIENPAQAFAALLARPEPVVLVTGSFYLLNHIRPLIEAQQ